MPGLPTVSAGPSAALAHGVPVVTTPTPLGSELVELHGCGLVVPFGDPVVAAAAVRRLHADPQLRERAARRGREAARLGMNGEVRAAEFAAMLEGWVKEANTDGQALRDAARVSTQVLVG